MTLSPSITSVATSDIVLSLPNLRQLETGEFDLDELVKKLTEALADDSKRNEILQLTGDIAVLVIECLDKVIFSDPFRAIQDAQLHSKMFSAVSRLSRNCQYLPRSYWIDPNTITLPEKPYRSGACADVYEGVHDGEAVAVKVLRTSNQESAAKLKKRLCREVIIWRHVSCPYILKFKGVFCHNDIPAIVTPWMPHGSITEYLVKHPDVDRLRLFVGVVKGVNYLHSRNIAHGDIKAPNILISNTSPVRAMLADFGFIRITNSVRQTTEGTGVASFMAPELLFPAKFGLDKGVPSKEGDVYALGMTVYQVLTGQFPFYPKREHEVIFTVFEGGRPPKPKNAEEIGMTEAIWELVTECWKEYRTERPVMPEILRRFCEVTGERKIDTAAESVTPQVGVPGNRNSMVSEDLSLTTFASSRDPDIDKGSLLAVTAAPLSLFNPSGSGEVTEVEEKVSINKDGTSKENRPVGTSTTPTGARTGGKRKKFWHKLKQTIAHYAHV